MRHLCWIGNPYFCAGLKDHDWDVTVIERRTPVITTWDDVCAACGREPDAVVLGDASLPPILAGIERWPCLTVFHCVDAHIHSWHPVYAQVFDLCSVSLKDELQKFEGSLLGAERILWLPPWAPDDLVPRDVEKQWDVLFAGTVDPQTTPKRHEFLDKLGERLPALHVTSGDFCELFPRAKIVLNYCERGDLNFRVFEALGAGACLLTPEVGHGQDELFPPDESLFTYPPDDMDALVATANRLLADDEVRAHAGAAGKLRVDAAHRASHRAATYSGWLRAQDAAALVAKRYALADVLFGSVLKLLYLHYAETTALPELRSAYLRLASAGS